MKIKVMASLPCKIEIEKGIILDKGLSGRFIVTEYNLFFNKIAGRTNKGYFV
jgi:hypothetical protein